MELPSQLQTFIDSIKSSEQGRIFFSKFKHYNKEGSIWTHETGCLVYTSLAIYYLLASPESINWLHAIVITFFFLGGLVYVLSTKFFRKLNENAENQVTKFLKAANKYIFMVLSFFPGLYFSFHFEDFVYRTYLVYHLVTSTYFLYKRCKEFELQPFMLGFGLSFLLRMITPTIRIFFSIFGSGWFITSLSSSVEMMIDLSIAVAFLMRLPEKYFPSTMMFGLKILKYLMIFSSWQTWFIIMVLATWKNLGSAAQAGWEATFGYEQNHVKKDDRSK